MPDQTGLDERLAGGREALLADITQPSMERLAARAAVLRRRRRAARGGAAALAVVAAVALVVRPGGEPAREVAEPPRVSPVYEAEGITINGLPDPFAALDVPGTVVDVEFADPEHGYAVSACEGTGGCRPSFAATADGGRTWASTPLPREVDARSRPELATFGVDRLVLRAGDRAYASRDGGRTWVGATVADAPTEPVAGDLLRLGGNGDTCAGGRVEVWGPDAAPRGPLPRQPAFGVCWVAQAPTATGAWWVGGMSADGRAAVAVTPDGGRTWQTKPLAVAGAARVATLGRYAYALVTGPGGELRAVFRSADRGATFTRVPATRLPGGVAGDAVPLLDGRLLLVEPAAADRVEPGGRWHVSADDGATFKRAAGTLPAVGRLARTPAGYVAYDLFNAGWTAFSTDGSTWRKLELR
jgi:photosystem II stability/assembly factor-like uncharacterized protein